ncbi:MAG: DUF1232 domain-containing protein [Gemmatimonadales bacterium]|nr:MAG: DUF1232 domain-containing protein [Gemmatimonadales bacterium]
MKGIGAALRGRFLRFRREIIVVAYAIRHPETPLRLRLAGAFFLLYLASPVDLIPIVVPVLGLLDDLVIVPWGLSQVVGRLPPTTRADAEEKAQRFIRRWVKRPLVFLLALIVTLMLLWALLLALLWWLFFG